MQKVLEKVFQNDVPTTALAIPKHYAYVDFVENSSNQKLKTLEQISNEVTSHIQAGVHEIILVIKNPKLHLSELLQTILSDTRQFCLRLTYIYPGQICDEVIYLMKTDSRILPYLDMHIVHSCNSVLKAMGLSTTKEQILSLLAKLRTEIPNITIRSNFIVGSTAETDEHFQDLCQFINQVPFENVKTSKCTANNCDNSSQTILKTDSEYILEHIPEHIPEEIKEIRLKTLLELQQKLVYKRNAHFIGLQLHVMVEGYHPESRLLMRGRHDGQCPEIDGSVIINDGRKVTAFGKKYLVEITDVSDYDLIGRVI